MRKRKNKKSLYLSIMFFFLSLSMISFGFFCDYNSDNSLLSNLKLTNNSSVEKSNGDINVNPNSEIGKSEISSTNDESLEAVNNNLRNSIEKKYGIQIRYGDETIGYEVGGLTTNHLINNNDINQALKNLNTNMGMYPQTFFQEFGSVGLSLTVYLIKNYSADNVTGITDSTKNSVIISIACDYSFDESINHEIYHYVDKYIKLKGGTYNNWSSLNPTDFVYGTRVNEYAYTKTKLKDSYFVNTYAEENEYEDRASTFEYMMGAEKITPFTKGTPIYKKAKIISNMLDTYFNCVTPNSYQYWERFID